MSGARGGLQARLHIDDFDATVLAKHPDGKVKIVSRHDEPKREGTTIGLGWGLAAARSSHSSPPSGS